jgi:pre-mRNA-splicing factor RBM22/SLT11
MNKNIDKLELPYKNPEVQEALAQVAKNFYPSAKRNLPHVCTFFLKGECNRGKACPYRHDNITEEELESLKKGGGSIDDRIKERFNGINDPVAKKILSKVKESHLPQAPADLNITTLFIGGIDDTVDEDELLK